MHHQNRQILSFRTHTCLGRGLGQDLRRCGQNVRYGGDNFALVCGLYQRGIGGQVSIFVHNGRKECVGMFRQMPSSNAAHCSGVDLHVVLSNGGVGEISWRVEGGAHIG